MTAPILDIDATALLEPPPPADPRARAELLRSIADTPDLGWGERGFPPDRVEAARETLIDVAMMLEGEAVRP